MIIYVLEMCRWASSENHSYVSGVYSTLKMALKEGIEHAEFRAGKYEPKIYMTTLDTSVTHNILCDNLTEALKLYEELKDEA